MPLYYWNDNNFRSLRYADMLLLYAEVLNELSGTPPAKAIECVNRVRKSCELTKYTKTAPFTTALR